jgi:hypothetical protein
MQLSEDEWGVVDSIFDQMTRYVAAEDLELTTSAEEVLFKHKSGALLSFAPEGLKIGHSRINLRVVSWAVANGFKKQSTEPIKPPNAQQPTVTLKANFSRLTQAMQGLTNTLAGIGIPKTASQLAAERHAEWQAKFHRCQMEGHILTGGGMACDRCGRSARDIAINRELVQAKDWTPPDTFTWIDENGPPF